MFSSIWLIGGTSESVIIAELLINNHFPCLISVTTDTAIDLYRHIPHIKFFVGKIDVHKISEFIFSHQIKAVIDASHPFAVLISQGAIHACQLQKIPYLRYERPLLSDGDRHQKEFSQIENLLSSNLLQSKRVLLTIGCNSLSLFKEYHQEAHLFARILPYSESILIANQAGFDNSHLIAMRPPFSFEFEMALWHLWQIDLVVTKSSGISGGEDIKRKVAQGLNIPLIFISRPSIDYPLVTNELPKIISWLRKIFPDYH